MNRETLRQRFNAMLEKFNALNRIADHGGSVQSHITALHQKSFQIVNTLGDFYDHAKMQDQRIKTLETQLEESLKEVAALKDDLRKMEENAGKPRIVPLPKTRRPPGD